MTSIRLISSRITPTKKMPLRGAIGFASADSIVNADTDLRLIKPGEIFTRPAIDRIETAQQEGRALCGISGDAVCVVADRGADYFIVVHDPQKLCAAAIADYADLYRETFCNPPYNQMAYAPPYWGRPLGAAQVILGRPPAKTDYIPLDVIDGFSLPPQLRPYMDPAATEAILKDRFSDPGYLACLYQRGTGRLCGFSFARAATLTRIWETEEWRWPLLLSGDKTVEADSKAFFAQMKAAFNLGPQDMILSVSGQAIHPDVRGKDGWFTKLMAAVSIAFTPDHAHLPGLTELSKTGASRVLNAAVATHVKDGILENGNPLAYVPLASHSLWHYEGPRSRLRAAIRHQIKKENRHAQSPPLQSSRP